MIKIEVYTVADPVAGSQRDQVIESLAAIGFAPVGASAPVATVSDAGPANEPKRMTAAEKKAAEKAAKEAELVAAKEAAAAAEAAKQPDPETAKQDAKDEAADTKAAEPEAVKLTHDSVRAVMSGYVQMYGMEAAQADVPGILGVAKVSELKDDQAALAKAILALAGAIEKPPTARNMAGDGISPEKIAEIKPLVVAAKAVK
ncbi:hypothetical protein [Bradyrhizobium sp. 33ap4]|uniref:hypothetical protein n=1 Tax=Bradyrhizobium sp. 33ap4 TaxID=3061630 RepID=UPI00292EA227|nr:hypothetical protein [Bradyrhizobium sp. 33ap4]